MRKIGIFPVIVIKVETSFDDRSKFPL